MAYIEPWIATEKFEIGEENGAQLETKGLAPLPPNFHVDLPPKFWSREEIGEENVGAILAWREQKDAARARLISFMRREQPGRRVTRKGDTKRFCALNETGVNGTCGTLILSLVSVKRYFMMIISGRREYLPLKLDKSDRIDHELKCPSICLLVLPIFSGQC